MSTQTITETEKNTKTIPPWHVVLLNDDEHSYHYVVAMLAAVFGFPPEKGFKHAKEVDASGRTILLTTSREHAELKQEQCLGFGPDPYVTACKGPMTVIIEPAC
jgi:ATP-dependent Clp protease adaptor protein ClpS